MPSRDAAQASVSSMLASAITVISGCAACGYCCDMSCKKSRCGELEGSTSIAEFRNCRCVRGIANPAKASTAPIMTNHGRRCVHAGSEERRVGGEGMCEVGQDHERENEQ